MIYTASELSKDALRDENRRLLNELERAYLTMEAALQQSAIEKEIAYEELQHKFNALEKLYSELSNKENLLIHMEKMSSMGQFIIEIIHELNNPLAAISGHAQLLLLMEHKPKIVEYLKTILKNTERMTNYLNRFRKMAYKSEEDFQTLELNDHLMETLETIEILKPKGIQLEKEISSQPMQSLGDPYQVAQIYMNLAKNAFDAMSTQGNRLRVRSTSVSAGDIKHSKLVGPVYCQKQTKWHDLIEVYDSFALVEFADNGSGIQPEVQTQIFDSFFTTKDAGKGSGLGLFISSDIVKRHSGNLALKSAPGKGATFQVLLPLRETVAQE